MHTRKEFLKFCDLKAGTAKFTIDVDFHDLYNMGGIGGLNDQLESEVEDGHLLCDLSYDAIALPKNNVIQIEVFVADLSEWLDEEETEETTPEPVIPDKHHTLPVHCHSPLPTNPLKDD